jgi:hypothetical protein
MKYLKEPSTWKGLTILLGVLGLEISPEHIVDIIVAGGTLYGLLAVLWDRN